MCWYRYNRMKVSRKKSVKRSRMQNVHLSIWPFDSKNAKKLDGFWCLVSGSMGNEFLICFNFSAHLILLKKNTLHLCVYLNGFKMCNSQTLDYLKNYRDPHHTLQPAATHTITSFARYIWGPALCDHVSACMDALLSSWAPSPEPLTQLNYT